MRENNPAGELERMWTAHRAFLRRLLISMTRDIDLAEDLLQDTYVRARTGFSGYHSGDSRAWLSAIAKSAFLTYARRMHYSRERCELTDQEADQGIAPGSQDHLDALSIRQAGDDPAFGTVKTLVIEYTYDGKPATATGTDPQIIDLVSPEQESPPCELRANALIAGQPGRYTLVRSSGRKTEITVPASGE